MTVEIVVNTPVNVIDARTFALNITDDGTGAPLSIHRFLPSIEIDAAVVGTIETQNRVPTMPMINTIAAASGSPAIICLTSSALTAITTDAISSIIAPITQFRK